MSTCLLEDELAGLTTSIPSAVALVVFRGCTSDTFEVATTEGATVISDKNLPAGRSDDAELC
jgi:hypothetical protein